MRSIAILRARPRRSSRSTPRPFRRISSNPSSSATSAARSPGAQTSRRGRFEQAEGGTLFLDEIGDMPPDLQVRLLRVLADGEFYRVGGHAPQKANVRVIAATHQNLEERVRRGLFREDLLHRLDVVRMRLPPLRERRDDIAPLARHFLAKSARELAVEPKVLSDDALKALTVFSFPGNVRQLENICHWITVMAPGQRIDVADLPAELREPAAGAESAAPGGIDWQAALDRELAQSLARGEHGVGDRLLREFKRTLILRSLAHTGGHRLEAAQWLGWGRNTLTRKIQELGLEPELAQGRRICLLVREVDDHRRVIGRPLALARVAVDAAGRAARREGGREQDVVDAQTVVLRKRELPVVPPAERLLRLREHPEAVLHTEPEPVAEHLAFGVGAKHLAAPELGIVDVAVFRRDVEIAGDRERRMPAELAGEKRRRGAAPVELVAILVRVRPIWPFGT